MPSNEGFLSRPNSLSKIFAELTNFILNNNKFNTVKDDSSISYYASKDRFYNGLKHHINALYRNTELATPISIKVNSAATHVLATVKLKHPQHFLK